MGLGKARRKRRLHACPDVEALASASSLVQKTTRPPFPTGSQGRRSRRQAVCSHGGGPRPLQGLPLHRVALRVTRWQRYRRRVPRVFHVFMRAMWFTPFCPSVCLALSPHVVSLKLLSLCPRVPSESQHPGTFFSWSQSYLYFIRPEHRRWVQLHELVTATGGGFGRVSFLGCIFCFCFYLLFFHISRLQGWKSSSLTLSFCKVIFSHLKSS